MNGGKEVEMGFPTLFCLVDVITEYFRDAHLPEGGEFVTLEDAKSRYGLSMEKLQDYAEQGFLRCWSNRMGVWIMKKMILRKSGRYSHSPQ